jgi:transcriptional regulator with XRE-family HTH domain
MTFGKRLQAMLDERGLSQRKFADMVMFSTSSVSCWCTDRSEPTLTAIAAMCDALGVSADYLVTGKEGNAE